MCGEKIMKVFSTFTGIGGFEVGIQNAFEATRLLQGIDHKDSSTANIPGCLSTEPFCVGYSEIDKYAISVYEKHFKGAKNYGDITKIKTEDLPDFDCLVGGFPCQAFSVAGKRGGFSDTRGTLFFELARILQAKQPRLFVFENVKGLLSHDGGKTFRTIIAAITELGYDVQWQVLNSKDFGVAQNRERVIFVGHLRGTARPEVFPIAGAISAHTFIRTIRAGGAASGTEKHARDLIQVNNPTHSNDRVYDDNGISPTLNTMQGGRRQPKINGPVIRRLTPLECERLQGFPDNWTVGESDTQRYKMAGNAVTTNVIQAVFERIFESGL